KAKDLRLEIVLTPNSRTKLAEGIAALGKANSRFPGLLKGDDTANGLITLSISPGVRDALANALKEASRKAQQEIKDDTKRERVEKLFAALAPAFDTGKLDVAYSLRGPDESGQATLVAAVRLKDLKKLKAAADELLKILPEADKARVKLGVDKFGDVSIHSIDIKKELKEGARKLFGEGPLYLAARKDALFVALGKDSLKAIKAALAAKAGPTAPIRFEGSLRLLAKLAAKDKSHLDQIEKLFTEGEDAKIVFFVQGGDTFRLRFRMDLAALRAISGLAVIGRNSGSPPRVEVDPPKK